MKFMCLMVSMVFMTAVVPAQGKSFACMVWLKKLLPGSSRPNPFELDFKKIEASESPIAQFYQTISGYVDPFTKQPFRLPGYSIENTTLKFKGQDYVTFHVLRQHPFFSERLGIFQGRLVVFKFFEAPDLWESYFHSFKKRFLSEVKLAQYLQEKHIKVSAIIDYSEADRIIIKEFIPGIPVANENPQTNQKVLEETNFKDLLSEPSITKRKIKKLQQKLKGLQTRIAMMDGLSSDFNRWSKLHNLIPYIDTETPSSLLLWNGEWYVNSPYPLF